MKTLSDAIMLRNRIIANLEEANFECCASVRRRLMTFVVAGAGFAGVETIGSINDFARGVLKHYPNLPKDELRFLLVHPGDTILQELSPSLGRYAQEKLTAEGVEILPKSRIAGADDRGVLMNDGTIIETNTIVWTAGTSPNPLLNDLPCAKEKGRLQVNEFLELQDYPNVWALGDCACIPDKSTGKFHPPTAQHAVREGKIAGRNIAAAIAGAKKRPFTFRTLGQLASIGRRTGVAEVFGLKFSGFIAWWLWRTIYLMKLPRLEKKIRVAFDWTLDLFFSKDIVQFMPHKAAHSLKPVEPLPDTAQFISAQIPAPQAVPVHAP
jgi:NADH dehydrogenase